MILLPNFVVEIQNIFMIQNLENYKCVLIVDSNLPIGEQANIAAVLAMTIGAKNNMMVGRDLPDADNTIHHGITQLNLPVLTACSDKIKEIHDKAGLDERVFIVDFTSTAQESRSYDEYTSKLAVSHNDELRYIGIGILGDKKTVNRYSGNLKLLR